MQRTTTSWSKRNISASKNRQNRAAYEIAVIAEIADMARDRKDKAYH